MLKVKKGVLERNFGSSALVPGVAHLSLKDHCMNMHCMYPSCLSYTLKINPIGERRHLSTIFMIAMSSRHLSNAVPFTHYSGHGVSASSAKNIRALSLHIIDDCHLPSERKRHETTFIWRERVAPSLSTTPTRSFCGIILIAYGSTGVSNS